MPRLLPGVTVSIVTYNTWERTADCIESVLKVTDPKTTEVLVLDNGAEDPPQSLLDQHVQIIRSDRNLGFGAGHNRNLFRASREQFLILNPDITVPAGGIESLSRLLSSSESAVAVAPLLEYPDGTAQTSVRNFPRVRTEFARIFGLDGRVGRSSSVLVDTSRLADGAVIEQPAGAAILVRTRVLQNLRGFDERFPMYFEDVDLCKRLQAEGDILLDKSVTFIHDGEGTAKGNRRVATFWIERSRCIYFTRHHHGIERLALLLLSLFSCVSHAMALAARAILRDDPSDRDKAAGYSLALASRLYGGSRYWRSRMLRK